MDAPNPHDQAILAFRADFTSWLHDEIDRMKRPGPPWPSATVERNHDWNTALSRVQELLKPKEPTR